MQPVLLQMSRGEFFTASQSLGRQSRKPYYIGGQAPLKLTATAATAKLAEREREREREACSPALRDNRVNCTQVGLICFGYWTGTKNNGLCSSNGTHHPNDANKSNSELIRLHSCLVNAALLVLHQE